MLIDRPFRLATAADGPVLARFIMWAGEGLPMLVWKDMAGPGEDPWDIGAARMARKAEAGEQARQGIGLAVSLLSVIGTPVASIVCQHHGKHDGQNLPVTIQSINRHDDFPEFTSCFDHSRRADRPASNSDYRSG